MQNLLVEVAVAVCILSYSTFTFYLLFCALRRRAAASNDNHKAWFYRERPAARRIVVEITTNGQNTEVVEDIIRVMKGYKQEFELWVLKEAYDKFDYSANQITVPASYKTKNGSLKKARALQYGIEFFHRRGYGSETYIIHLDDDSLVNESYIRFVGRLKATAGQGNIRLRGHGKHLLSTLADMIRVTNCDLFCEHFNADGKPKYVHGEGLAIRCDVEHRIGWDYGKSLGIEDLIMGISIPYEGYTFTHIPDDIYIAPPLCFKDFYRQRRRWTHGFVVSSSLVKERDPSTYWFIVYRRIVGWMGLIGWALWLPDIFLIGLKLPIEFALLGVFNLLISFYIYEHGVLRTDKKYTLRMIALFIPVMIYESSTLLYTLLFPPKKGSFDVISKARV